MGQVSANTSNNRVDFIHWKIPVSIWGHQTLSELRAECRGEERRGVGRGEEKIGEEREGEGRGGERMGGVQGESKEEEV